MGVLGTKPSPLQEHVLLTVEPSPHPQLMHFFSGPCNEIYFFSVLFLVKSETTLIAGVRART